MFGCTEINNIDLFMDATLSKNNIITMQNDLLEHRGIQCTCTQDTNPLWHHHTPQIMLESCWPPCFCTAMKMYRCQWGKHIVCIHTWWIYWVNITIVLKLSDHRFTRIMLFANKMNFISVRSTSLRTISIINLKIKIEKNILLANFRL